MRFMQVTKEFLVGVRSELKKVTWTSRRDLVASTGVVIVATLIIALAVGIADKLFTMGILGEKFGLIPFMARLQGG